MFTPTLINGADFEVVTSAKKLQVFQFAKLYATSLVDIIEIANENGINVTNTRF